MIAEVRWALRYAKVVLQGVRRNCCPYSVFCHDNGKTAGGSNSPPEMIIE